MWWLAALALLCSSAVLAAGTSEEETALARGKALVAPFKSELMSTLSSALNAGPAAAVVACRVEAPALANDSAPAGVRLGRASDRLRNPANRAPDWVAPLLADYLAGIVPRAPRSVFVGDGRRGYVEPIVIQSMCLTCHGERLSDDVQARLDTFYPEDRATGYRVDELRGVFWVEHPQ
ncbi:MAG: DUF3365 domain-containing protein [Gammaproteobacteria bacterium]